MMSRAVFATLASVCAAALVGCASSGAGGASAAAGARAEAPSVEYAYSHERRTITTRTIGDAGLGVLIVGGIHGSEPEGLAPVQHLIEVLEEDGWPAKIVVVEDLNPDGSTLLSRYNSRGVDLNRNWPASNFEASFRHGEEPLSELETQYGYTLIQRVDPVLVIVLHSIHSGPFVNYDGPALRYAELFATAADAADTAHTWNLQPDMGYETPGSMGTYVGVDRGTPILTIEFDRGHDERSATAALIAGTQRRSKKSCLGTDLECVGVAQVVELLCELVVERVARLCCGDLGDDGCSGEGEVADEVEQLVSRGLVVKRKSLSIGWPASSSTSRSAGVKLVNRPRLCICVASACIENVRAGAMSVVNDAGDASQVDDCGLRGEPSGGSNV